MIEKVTMYKNKFGEIFDSEEKARLHENYETAKISLMNFLPEMDDWTAEEMAEWFISNAKETIDILRPFDVF